MVVVDGPVRGRGASASRDDMSSSSIVSFKLQSPQSRWIDTHALNSRQQTAGGGSGGTSRRANAFYPFEFPFRFSIRYENNGSKAKTETLPPRRSSWNSYARLPCSRCLKGGQWELIAWKSYYRNYKCFHSTPLLRHTQVPCSACCPHCEFAVGLLPLPLPCFQPLTPYSPHSIPTGPRG